jgi:hypothetical protein
MPASTPMTHATAAAYARQTTIERLRHVNPAAGTRSTHTTNPHPGGRPLPLLGRSDRAGDFRFVGQIQT